MTQSKYRSLRRVFLMTCREARKAIRCATTATECHVLGGYLVEVQRDPVRLRRKRYQQGGE